MTPAQIKACAGYAQSRFDLLAWIINKDRLAKVAEIGVRRGVFAEQMLGRCPSIDRYYMVDPWRHLPGWNKRGNLSDDQFEACFEEMLERTAFASQKRVMLNGTTLEMADALPHELDLIYLDGDHTLRGVLIDLVLLYDKVRPGGFIAGDDFTPSIWQHSREYEPSLVFPAAVHFAEAKGVPIYGLPHDQFVIVKEPAGFAFHDLTGKYGESGLREQMAA